ncbi:hypothetical protein ACKC9G_07825 [Pokkaliibacter sp. CJK22405]|uniref:hypothetical protein n=1 Tax=Pokkaliibacter sp. CJK22405 TaxID=3384615 RepID=UPI003984BA42
MIDEDIESAYVELCSEIEALKRRSYMWFVNGEFAVPVETYSYGGVVQFAEKDEIVSNRESCLDICNIRAVSLEGQLSRLFFLPDRILFISKGVVRSESIHTLRAHEEDVVVKTTQTVQQSAQVVGQTWEYVNNVGAKNESIRFNKEVLLCRYQKLTLSSDRGMLGRILSSQSIAEGSIFFPLRRYTQMFSMVRNISN